MIAAPMPDVLLVETIKALSALYTTMLSRNGRQVDAACSAGGALEAHRSRQHRVVLLDLPLPDGDGLRVLRTILRRDPNAKVLVITADGSVGRAVEAMREGAFDALVKPFDEGRLAAALNAALPAGGRPGATPDGPARCGARGLASARDADPIRHSPGFVFEAAAEAPAPGFAEPSGEDPFPLAPPAPSEGAGPAAGISRAQAVAALVGRPFAEIERDII